MSRVVELTAELRQELRGQRVRIVPILQTNIDGPQLVSIDRLPPKRLPSSAFQVSADRSNDRHRAFKTLKADRAGRSGVDIFEDLEDDTRELLRHGREERDRKMRQREAQQLEEIRRRQAKLAAFRSPR